MNTTTPKAPYTPGPGARQRAYAQNAPQTTPLQREAVLCAQEAADTITELYEALRETLALVDMGEGCHCKDCQTARRARAVLAKVNG